MTYFILAALAAVVGLGAGVLVLVMTATGLNDLDGTR